MISAQLSQTIPTSQNVAPVAVAYGDGIGPEIMSATLRILEASGAQLNPIPVEIGERAYLAGKTSGINDDAWDVIRSARVMLKAPITTPQGGGMKSLNVTLRKSLGLFANVRPCIAYHPFVHCNHPNMNVVIVRENEEDLYAGIEHRQTEDVYQCLKLISRPGCERIVRYAFEYARAHGRKKVTCMTKDNIMKLTDGLFHKVFDEISAEYPEIKADHMIIDIGAARLATRPEMFDVIVAPNLYGDIISDIAAEVSGSVGLAPSVNFGDDVAIFEAIHGSAPDIAGLDVANPSGLLLSAVQMLIHMGQPEVATRISNAWLKTIEEGIHTADIRSARTTKVVGTQAFADAVIANLDQKPQTLPATEFAHVYRPISFPRARKASKKEVNGVDIFVRWNKEVDQLAENLLLCGWAGCKLQIITNRGVQVWPHGQPETKVTDHWRCRFVSARPMDGPSISALFNQVTAVGLDVIKLETLCSFDGERGYSLAQGQ